jgi:hypothetical protein
MDNPELDYIFNHCNHALEDKGKNFFAHFLEFPNGAGTIIISRPEWIEKTDLEKIALISTRIAALHNIIAKRTKNAH